jgi:hypothetical protein
MIEDLKYPLLRLWIGVQDHGVFSIGAILGLIVFYTARYIASPYRKLPQGPHGYPIIGSLVEMRAGQCFMFSEWQKKYDQFAFHHLLSPYLSWFAPGDLVHLNVAGQPVVIINSPKVGVALLDRRAVIYSDRPRCIVGSDIMSGGLFFSISQYNDT